MKTNQRAANHADHFQASTCHAVDGDTIIAEINLGFHTTHSARIRLKGFYAPELDGRTPEQGIAARKTLQDALNGHQVTFPKRGARQDNYGRWLLELWIDGQPAIPEGTIWPYQMDERAHAEDLKAAKANRARKRGAL